MLKKISLIISAVCLSLLMVVPTLANTYRGGDWHVEFTQDKKMVSNFTSGEMQDVLRGLQPGDDAYFSVRIQNLYKEPTDWYMTNKIIRSLEDLSYNQATAGGAYTYRLTYTNNSGAVKVLFDSDKVGGDTVSPAGEGLNEATSALKEFFLLDRLGTNEGGVVDLYVGLDGETQNNDYQDTLAELQVNFAVELGNNEIETETTTPGDKPLRPTKTGDESNLIMYYILIGVAGLALLAVAIIRLTAGRKKEEK